MLHSKKFLIEGMHEEGEDSNSILLNHSFLSRFFKPNLV